MIKRINIKDTFDVDAFETHSLNLDKGTLDLETSVSLKVNN